MQKAMPFAYLKFEIFMIIYSKIIGLMPLIDN